MDCYLTQRQITTLVLAHLLLLACVNAQDRIEMKCNPSLRHRYEDCPSGYCCVRDEFLPTFVYCRKFGARDDNCTTKETESECPCDDGLMCLANIQGKYPSVYGRCVVNITSPATTATTVTSKRIPIDTTVASEGVNSTNNLMMTSDADGTMDMMTTGDDFAETTMPVFTDSILNSTDDTNSSVTMET